MPAKKRSQPLAPAAEPPRKKVKEIMHLTNIVGEFEHPDQPPHPQPHPLLDTQSMLNVIYKKPFRSCKIVRACLGAVPVKCHFVIIGSVGSSGMRKAAM